MNILGFVVVDTLLFIITLLISLAVLYFLLEYYLTLFIRLIYTMNMYRQCKGKLVLTYDDGPGERLESGLLQVLEKYGAKATFFLNAQRVLRYPERSNILKNADQEVALHCYKHLNAWRVFQWKFIKDINRAYQITKHWLTSDRLLRFPYGKMTTTVYFYYRIKGFTISYWTHDSGDTHKIVPAPDEIVQKILKTNGGVVLMHSFDRDDNTIYRENYVIHLTELLLQAAKEKNWKVCRYSDIYCRE